MRTTGYSGTARVLHWISAAVIIWATLAGFFLATLETDSELRAILSSLNISLTTTFVPFFIARVVVAAGSKRPPMIEMPKRQQAVARTAHLSLYVLTATVLVSGLLMMEHDISLFGLASVPNPLSDAHWNGVFYSIHRYACMALFLLVGLHISAVIRHQRAGRNVLARIT